MGTSPCNPRYGTYYRHATRPEQPATPNYKKGESVPQLPLSHHHIRRIKTHPLPSAKNLEQLILRQRKLSRLLRQQRIQNLKLRLNHQPRGHR